MRVQDFIAEQTQKGADAVLRHAHATAADKLEWRPLDQGRSVLNQLQECAFQLGMLPDVVASRKMPDFTPEFWDEMMRIRAEWSTLELVESILRENAARWIETIRTFPDEQLEDEMILFGGFPWRMVDVLNVEVWNLNYHTGQICYIQTLLGDREMR